LRQKFPRAEVDVKARTGPGRVRWLPQDPNLPGDSTNENHRNEITLVSYTQAAGTTACFKAIAIKLLDRTSPGLALLAVTNQVVPSMTVTLAKAGEPPVDVFVALLENVVMGNVELVKVDGTPVPTERVTVRPRRATPTFRPQWQTGSRHAGDDRHQLPLGRSARH